MVTQHFAEHLIDVRDGHFRPDYLATRRFDHRKGRLRIGPLMIMLQERFPFKT
jgi:hypothetical protein